MNDEKYICVLQERKFRRSQILIDLSIYLIWQQLGSMSINVHSDSTARKKYLGRKEMSPVIDHETRVLVFVHKLIPS